MKKQLSINYYLLSTILPTFAIVIMFCWLTSNVNSDINFIESEIRGTNKIIHIQNNLDLEKGNILEQSLMEYKNIAHDSNLILDQENNTHILMENLTNYIPSLIIYNSVLKKDLLNHNLSEPLLVIEEYNIKRSRMLLKDNIILIKHYISIQKYKELNKIFTKLNTNQKTLEKYLESNINNKLQLTNGYLDKTIDMINKNVLYSKQLFKINNRTLLTILEKRLQIRSNTKTIILIIGLLSLIFIIFNHYNYYRRNKMLITKINVINKQLEVISITDSLTSLFNRRYFDNTFLRQYRITKRNKESLVFVMCDVDYFKQYNDIYGHDKGDEALRSIAKVLQSSLHRPDDYAFRLGGEEFGLIFSNTDEEKALEFVNKIRTKIEKLHIKHGDNKASKYLTISMGLIYYEHKIVRDTKELYAFADKALYFSKDKGRNQVTSLNIDNNEESLSKDNIAEYFCNENKSIS